MNVTFFSSDAQCQAFMDAPEATCLATAEAQGWRLLAGDWRGHYWPLSAPEPIPCETLPYQDIALALNATLTLAESQAGGLVCVNGETYTLVDDDPLELTFASPGVYPVQVFLIGYHPCAFTVTVDED